MMYNGNMHAAKRRTFFVLLLIIALSRLCAQTGTNDPNMVSSQFDMTGFPQWSKDLRRGEIIAFGVFPFAYFFSNFAVDGYRSAVNGWDSRYAPWPFTGAGAVDKTQDERFLTIGVAAGTAVLIALIDYGIVRYRRSRLEKEIRSLPGGTPIIIRRPLYEDEIAVLNESPRELAGNDYQTTEIPMLGSSNNGRADPDAADWDIETLDTARDVDYLSSIEQDVILEMNKVRTDPKKYAELYIQPRLRYFSGRNYSVPGQITVLTQEGTAAVNDCIAALNRANSAGPLMPEKGLSLAAKDHVTDQSRTGQTGHNGSDRSTPQVRMNRYGVFSGSYTFGENIAYGSATGRDIVCELLIDDGVANRGHRTNIMNRAFTQTGAAYGTHPQYRTSCTITYATGYTSN